MKGKGASGPTMRQEAEEPDTPGRVRVTVRPVTGEGRVRKGASSWTLTLYGVTVAQVQRVVEAAVTSHFTETR